MKTQTHFLLILVIILNFNLKASPADNPKGKGIEISNIDSTVSPSHDFYQFAVGSWLKNNPIPADYGRWGSFNMVTEKSDKVLLEIFETAATDKNLEKGSLSQKVGDYYFTGMDTIKIEQDGYAPIEPMLQSISSIKSKEDLYRAVAELQLKISKPLFSFFAEADAMDSKMNTAIIAQGGLGLPDRDYYLKDDDRSKQIREKYLLHIINLFKLTGMSEEYAKKDADAVMSFETKLANVSRTRVELRDPVKNTNNMSYDDVKKLAPNFDWDLYMASLNIDKPKQIDVGQPDFIKGMSIIIKDMRPEDFIPYLKWHLIKDAADFLSSSFVNERFEFTGKFLRGSKSLMPRWKRVLRRTNSALGEIAGQLFVEKTFSPEAKEGVQKMVLNLVDALKERIITLDWMSEATKKAALNKLSAFTVKVGYPDKWKDFTSLVIERDSYLQNEMRAIEFRTRDNLSRIGKPVDKGEWGLLPQTVNAYYEPLNNEIVFPAAILQPPFYNLEADDAVNYGGIGTVIGHEITHGFDDMGSQFDAEGNLKDWWTEEDYKKFQDRGSVMIDQFNSFILLDSIHVNGELTQGENIADLGGLNVSFAAFKKTEQYKKGELVEGFTPAQRFFLSYAQTCRSNIREETLRLDLKTETHSPSQFRVNAPLSNMPEFWEAFNVKPGDPMRRPKEKQVKIW